MLLGLAKIRFSCGRENMGQKKGDQLDCYLAEEGPQGGQWKRHWDLGCIYSGTAIPNQICSWNCLFKRELTPPLSKE